jgi:hypothetical protein
VIELADAAEHLDLEGVREAQMRLPVFGDLLARTWASASCGPTGRSISTSTWPPLSLTPVQAGMDHARVVEHQQ